MSKVVKAKVFNTEVTFEAFSKVSGTVEVFGYTVYGEKLTDAKAERLAKGKCKLIEQAQLEAGTPKKLAKVTFLKVSMVTFTTELWGMELADFMKYAHKIEEEAEDTNK